MKHLGDITQLSGHDVPVVDVVTGGSPCQDLSVAGKRAGLEGERSGLFMEQIRIVKEMREHDRQNGRADGYIRPRYMVWENVAGSFSSNKGKDFQAVLTEIVKIVEPYTPDVPLPDKGKWTKSGCIYDEMGGWSVAWRVHDAQFWGVPQRRKRIALVADFNGLSAPEILFERKGKEGNYDERETQRKYAKNIDKGSETIAFSFYPNAGKNFSLKLEKELLGTIRACNRNAVIIEKNQSLELRYFTPLEYERAQGFPDGWTDIGEYTNSKGKVQKASDTARYKALGNTIALPFWQYLARRICAQYERDITMGSLFDGISGFPFVFKRCGAEPVWSSEIEEFPIAVAKQHFGDSDEGITGDVKKYI